MSHQHANEELSWEDAIARFLEDNPDYFERHPDLLLRLRIPHLERGGSISLIERQVSVLRRDHAEAQTQLRDLVQIARDNDVLAARLHHFAIAMIDAGSLDDVLATAQDLLRQEFQLEGVRILLQGDIPGLAGRPEFVAPREARFEGLFALAGERESPCSGRLAADSMEYLFGRAGANIGSLALIPLRHPAHRGLLALGAQDPARFRPDMGTVFLLRLGEVLIAALARFLRTP